MQWSFGALEFCGLFDAIGAAFRLVLSNIAAVWFVGSRQPGDTSLKLAMILVFFFECNFRQKNVGFRWGWHGHEGSKLGLGENFFLFPKWCFGTKDSMQPRWGVGLEIFLSGSSSAFFSVDFYGEISVASLWKMATGPETSAMRSKPKMISRRMGWATSSPKTFLQKKIGRSIHAPNMFFSRSAYGIVPVPISATSRENPTDEERMKKNIGNGSIQNHWFV